MLDVDAIRDDRQMRALTGLDLGAFCDLIAPFAAACQQQADALFPPHRPRQRQAGAGRKGHLPSPEAKLLLLLYYLKNYPTFDVLGATFGLHRSKAHRYVHQLAPALQAALAALGVLPVRQITSLEEMQAVFADVPTLLLDATERGRQRPAAAVDRPASYSGKKTLHRQEHPH
jgi:hypothetical protein